ncbi:hypothetical protein [Marinifilum sp.]|uniref:hypothetical protein n=1 Tax=Marinifilum sp. TaxID=2033137 RepID=UPI003BADB83A
MKTMIVTMIFLLILNIDGISQIKLEGTVNSKYKSIQMDDGTFRYAKYNGEKEAIYIYNLDNTIWRTINLPLPKNHHLDEVKLISQKVFNKDDLVEIVYSCVEHTVPDNYEDPTVDFGQVKFTLNIINEMGESLLRVEDSNEMEIVKSKGGTKLLVYKHIGESFSGEDQTLIYNLP